MSKKILIIEDDKDIVNLLSLRLKASGYDLLTAMDGVVGLDMAKAEGPDLIILDVMLPELNGFTICSMLKGNPEYASIPIIMLTARDQMEDRTFEKEFQPDAFITKPFDAQELMGAVNKLVKE